MPVWVATLSVNVVATFIARYMRTLTAIRTTTARPMMIAALTTNATNSTVLARVQ